MVHEWENKSGFENEVGEEFSFYGNILLYILLLNS